MFHKVTEFHNAFAHPVAKVPITLSEERKRARMAWMLEELREFEEAFSIEDHADALIDLIYFALGSLVEMGVEADWMFDLVHAANMAKLGPNGRIMLRNDGKIQKPDGWQAPEPQIRSRIWRLATAAFLGDDRLGENDADDLVVRDGDCLLGCLLFGLKKLKPGVDWSMQWARTELGLNDTLRSEDGVSDLEWGVKVDVHRWREAVKRISSDIGVSYTSINDFMEARFDEAIRERLAKDSVVIATLSAGSLFRHDRRELGHAVILVESRRDSVVYFDTVAEHFGYHECSLDDLYVACRVRDGGLLLLKRG